MRKYALAIISTFGFLLSYGVASAHEAYVLPYGTFWDGMKEGFSTHAFYALRSPDNIHTTLIIVVSVLVGLTLNFFFRQSRLGQKLTSRVERYSHFGPHFVRVTIAIALFFSAASNTFLGPELHGDLFPYSQVVRIAL